MDAPRIALWQYGRHSLFDPLPTFDPHCLAAQAYMKFAAVPYVENNCNNPAASPVNKLPVLAIHGRQVVTHTDIYSELSKMGYNLDARLSEEAKADAEAFTALVQNRLHDAQLFNWFAEQANYDEVIQLVFTRTVSFPLSFFLPRRIKNSVLSHLSQAGIKDSKIAYEEAERCYKALATKLGSKSYFYGNEPTTLDAVVFGFLATQFIPELPVRNLHYLILQHDNLVNFVNRILKTYFSAANPVLPDPEPAARWLKAWRDEHNPPAPSAEKPASEPTKDYGSYWAIAAGIGVTVLFVASQNVQFALLTALLRQKLGWSVGSSKQRSKDDSHASRHALSKEQAEERAKWFGGQAADSAPSDGSHGHSGVSVDLEDNPMKHVFRFAPDDDQEVYIGDDGNAYDWDEKYLEEMETGSDIPEDHEDLGEDEEEHYD